MDIKRPSFHTRLLEACQRKQSYLCVGIDPRAQYLPECWQAPQEDLEATARSYLGFGKEVIDLIHQDVPVIKPQSAFFETLGFEGVKALEELSHYAQSKNLLVIGDVKRGDIGSTAEAYATAAFRIHHGKPLYDAVTVNPYLGRDGVKPFIDHALQVGSGIFVLCKTSNPSSVELQDLKTSDADHIYDRVAALITEWGATEPGCVGAVVGATHPKELSRLREKLPHAWILIPGIGAQGGTIADVASGFWHGPQQSLLSASRSITFPWASSGQSAPPNWQDSIRAAVDQTNQEIRLRLFK